MRDLFLLLAWLAMVPPLVAHPFVGLLLWAWTAGLSPNAYIFGFMQAVPFNKAVAIVTLLRVFLGREPKAFRLDATTVLFALLLAIGLLSAANAIGDPEENRVRCENLAKILVFGFLISAVATTRLRLHALLLMVCLGLGFHGVVEGLKFVASGGSHHVIGISSLGDNNTFALVMLMIIPMMAYLRKYSADRRIGWALLAGLCLCVMSVISTFSRGGFIGLVILAPAAIRSGRRMALNFALAGAVLAAFAVFAPPQWVERIDSINQADKDSSFMGRVVAWKISTLIALDHPLIGGGFHAVQDSTVWNGYRDRFHTLDFVPTGEPDIVAHAAHSIYFEILGDLGFPGLAVFLGLLAAGFANAAAVRRRCRGKPELLWAYDMAGALRLSLVAYAVTGAALSCAYYEIFYIAVAVLAMLRRIAVSQEKQAAPVAAPSSAAAPAH